jgi:hypothetical protein
MIFVPYKDNKLLCTKCSQVYDPKREFERYHELEIIDKDTVSAKIRRPRNE